MTLPRPFTLSRRVKRWLAWGSGAFIGSVVVLAWPMSPLFQDPFSTVLLDRNGALLGASVALDGQWRFPASDSVPERFATCLIQFEDRHFMDHHGVHLPSLVRALKQNISGARRVSGGSTITMQVARLSYRGAERSYWQKLVEMIVAWRIELRYDKHEILALFASHAPFGGNVVGLDAAAWRYYGRPADRLSWAESATLAVLPNAPSAIYPGKGQQALREKRDRLLDRLLEVRAIDTLEWTLARAEALPGRSLPLPQRAPHLLATLRAGGHEGERVRTTIDGALQDRTTAIVGSYAATLAANEVHNAAALVVDLPTGEVLAYVGNMPGTGREHSPDVDIVRAARSTGSILKPFLYADMLDKGEALPNMLLPDIPSRYDGFDPRNYDERYVGAVPLSIALARSLNVPAVRSLRAHGVSPTLRVLRAMGLERIDRSAAHYGLSLIVGGAECDLWSITGAYASLGRIVLNHGSGRQRSDVHEPVVLADRTAAPGTQDPVLGAASIYFVLKALREVARPESEGGWNYFGDAQRISWKTGTSMGQRDAWAVGITDRACVGVWTGNADGEGRPGLTGTLAAAPILFELFRQLPPGRGFDPPYDDMTRLAICRKSGFRADPDCPVVDTLWAPRTGDRSAPCPYHQRIRVDADEQHRVTIESPGHDAVWFVLPPAMEHYYAPGDPTYHFLPPWSDPELAAQEDRPMELIYPENGTRVLVPVDLGGQRGQIVMEAAHRTAGIAVHWHLDGTYIGTTKGDHRMTASPDEGSHVLLLTDANGHSLSITFEVIGNRGAHPQ
jgi:penicillin-binding protein 1C